MIVMTSVITLLPVGMDIQIKIKKENFQITVENILNSIENRLIGESKIRFKRNRIEAKKNSKPNPIELEE